MKAIPLWIRIAGPLVLIALIVVAARGCVDVANHSTDVAVNAAEDKGAATVRAEAAEEGVRDVLKSQEARAAVDRDDAARIELCRRTSRTPDNCQPAAR